MVTTNEFDIIPYQVSNNTSSDRIVTPKVEDYVDRHFFQEKPNELYVSGVDDRKTPSDVHSNMNASRAQSEDGEIASQRKCPSSGRRPKLKKKPTPISVEVSNIRINGSQCTHQTKALPDSNGGSQPLSYIYVTAKSGINYRLQFKATDVIYEPIFIYPRKCKSKVNEKDAQTISHIITCEEYSSISRKPYLIHPKYIVDPNLAAPVKTVLPPLRVYSTNQINANSNPISRTKQSSTTGFVYLKKGDITMRIVVKAMPITKLHVPVPDDIKDMMNRLNMPPSDTVKNQARIIVRYKNDVLRVIFNLTECSLTKLPERKSLAIQTDNKLVLRYEYSPYSQKMVYLEIPQTTYEYRDPMVEIRRLNDHFARLKIAPLWKHELFHKRISESRGANAVDKMVDKTVKKSRGSYVIFEGFNAIATANGGLYCANIYTGLEEYEEKMYSLLGYTDGNCEEANENSSAFALPEDEIINGINDVDLIHNGI